MYCHYLKAFKEKKFEKIQDTKLISIFKMTPGVARSVHGLIKSDRVGLAKWLACPPLTR